MSGTERQRFKGKTAVVTGGTSGSGLAMARRLLRAGATDIVPMPAKGPAAAPSPSCLARS